MSNPYAPPTHDSETAQVLHPPSADGSIIGTTTLTEADMAAGLSVVASRVGQLAQLIRHEENGLLYPPGDAVALAAALERLRREPALRQRLGRAARALVLRQHTWAAVARRIVQFAERASAPVFAGISVARS